MTGHHRPDAGTDPARFWDQRYAERDRIWSGRVNPVLAGIAGELPTGSALDLGCGEGGDAIWLAGRGWQVTAVDVSAVALDRARAVATAAGVADRIRFRRHDLSADFPAGAWDLVSAQFLRSPVDFPRTAVLQRAAAAVTPGGRLLVVDHAAPPPWASAEHLHDEFPTAEQTWQDLRLPDSDWKVERVGSAERQAAGPDGQAAILVDTIILARRIH